MIGRFNDPLSFEPGTDKLKVAGTLECDADDAGKRVRIGATIKQGTERVACSDDFTMPNPAGTLNWSMEVSAGNISAGSADGCADAEIRDNGETMDWKQPGIQIQRS
jgi:hypothetical protein